MVTFDPSMTCKESLAKCFKNFTNPNRTSNHMAKRGKQPGPIPRCKELTIYTDRACINNRKLNAQCEGGVYFDQNNPRNLAIRIPGESQPNQVGELEAVITAINATAPYQPGILGKRQLDRNKKRPPIQESSAPNETPISENNLLMDQRPQRQRRK